MSKKKAVKVIVVTLFLIYLLFASGFAPKQIAKLGASLYVNRFYQEENLDYVNVEWVPQLGMYMVSFQRENEQYNFIMSGKNVPFKVWYDPFVHRE